MVTPMPRRLIGNRFVLKLLIAVMLPAVPSGSLLASPQANASGTDSLTHQLADKLTDDDKKGVLVVALKPVEGDAWAFGAWMADQVSTSFANQGQSIEVIDRGKLAMALQAQNLTPPDEFKIEKTFAIAKAIGAATLVVGSYGAAENGIGVTLAAFRISELGNKQSKTFQIATVSGKIPLPELGDHLGVTLDSLRPKDGVYKAGVGGVSIPTLVKFVAPVSMKVPDIDLQGFLREKHGSGTIVLRFVLNTEGRATQIGVIQPIGFGIDAQYVKALPESEFKPAVDVDNRPVPVWFKTTFAVNLK